MRPDEDARSRKQVESLFCNLFRLLDWENISNWQKPISVIEEQFGCPTAFLSTSLQSSPKLVFNKVQRAGLSICLVICEFYPSFNTHIFLCFTLKTLILKVLVFILKSEKRLLDHPKGCCILLWFGAFTIRLEDFFFFYVVFLSGWDTEPKPHLPSEKNCPENGV